MLRNACANDTLTSSKSFAVEKRMDLVLSSPKYIDSLFMTYWYSEKSSSFKTLSMFLKIFMLVENAKVVTIQIGVSL